MWIFLLKIIFLLENTVYDNSLINVALNDQLLYRFYYSFHEF